MATSMGPLQVSGDGLHGTSRCCIRRKATSAENTVPLEMVRLCTEVI